MNSSNFDRHIIRTKKKSPKLLNRKMGEIVQDFLRGGKFCQIPHLVFHIFRGLAVLTIPGIVEWSHRGWGGLDLWWTFKLNGDFLCLNDSGSLILSMFMHVYIYIYLLCVCIWYIIFIFIHLHLIISLF